MLRRFAPAILVVSGFLVLLAAAFLTSPTLGLAVIGTAAILAGIDLRSPE